MNKPNKTEEESKSDSDADSDLLIVGEKPALFRAVFNDEKTVLTIDPDMTFGVEKTPIPVKLDVEVIDYHYRRLPNYSPLDELSNSSSVWDKWQAVDKCRNFNDARKLHRYWPRSEREQKRLTEVLNKDYPNIELDSLVSCQCTDGCSWDCPCKKMTYQDNFADYYHKVKKKVCSHKKFQYWKSEKETAQLNFANFPYKDDRLKTPCPDGVESGELFTGIITECNKRCKCGINGKCSNRLTQDGLKVKLCLFLTEKKGWGVRAEEPIKKGTFVGVYLGLLVEQRKRDETRNEYADRIDRKQYRKYEFSITKSGIERPQNYAAEALAFYRNNSKLARITNTRGSQVPEDQLDWLPENRPQHNKKPREKRLKIENKYSWVTDEFIIDSANYGTICRFFNHACSDTTVRSQLIYDNRQDQRLPTVAFFAKRNIEIGEELTWDYNLISTDESVVAKVKCHCGSPHCQG